MKLIAKKLQATGVSTANEIASRRLEMRSLLLSMPALCLQRKLDGHSRVGLSEWSFVLKQMLNIL